MKKSSTAVAQSKRNFHQKLTIGLDLGDRSTWMPGRWRGWRGSIHTCWRR